MNWQLLIRAWIMSGGCAVTLHLAGADDPAQTVPTQNAPVINTEATPERAAVRDALRPITQAILQATHSRAIVELTTRSMIDGRVIATETTTYRIASKAPNLYRVHLNADQQIHLVSDGELASVLLDDKAFYQLKAPRTLQAVVTDLPVPLGPYPEPLMAMTLAGVDVAVSLLTDMQTLEVANHDPYDGTAAVQLRGKQFDGVSWVLWLATEQAKHRPLRMKVDLTPVIVGEDGAGLPENFTFELDFKFTLWRMDGEFDKSIFTFKPPAGAQRFQSLEDYAQVAEIEMQQHPLVGSAAPDFTTELLDGTAFELSKQRGKIVVLDFWATWCGPCVEAMPVITEVTESFAARDVVLYAINIGQLHEQITEFLQRLEIEIPVLLDPEGKIAAAYAAEAIPQTVLIGKDGRVEAVHVGFAGLDALKQELSDQLELLASGGKLIVAEEDECFVPAKK